jgi:ribonuclease VapC
MILDTSAVIAILRAEKEGPEYARAIERSPRRSMSAANYLETAIVIDASRDPIASRRFDDFLSAAAIKIEPVTQRQAQLAREAYRDFGKGRRHSANLNFGDCFAYALARDTGERLLFKGSDFAGTDIHPALKQEV